MPSKRSAGKKITLIYNPGAGDDRKPTTGQVKALIKEAGYRIRVQSTHEQQWKKALKKPASFVAVAGGDGTVGSVARELIGTDMPIAVLPMGTANNVSKTLGIIDMPVTQLIRSWKSARRLSFDAGMARGPWGERHFIEGVGTGLLTHLIPRLSDSKTLNSRHDRDVKVAYAQQMFHEHVAHAPVVNIQASLDGADISGRYLLFEVLNMQYVGPNLFLAPNVVRNNGELEVILVEARHRKKLQSYIKHWQAGKPMPPQFITRRGRHLEMHWTGFKLHIDDKFWPPENKKKGGKRGESKPKAPARIDIVIEPSAVKFLVPAEVHSIEQTAKRSRRKALKQSAARTPAKKQKRA